jgi:hypothetical protein
MKKALATAGAERKMERETCSGDENPEQAKQNCGRRRQRPQNRTAHLSAAPFHDQHDAP